jgi:hypothetical protein
VKIWIVAPYGFSRHVGGYQRFGGTYRLHLQDRSEDGDDNFLLNIGNHLTATTQKTTIRMHHLFNCWGFGANGV